MKKFFWLVSLFFVCSIFFSQNALAQEHIEDFKVDITADQDGTLSVVEQIIYDFGTEYKHGIFRTIPLLKTNDENKNYLLKIDKITVTDELRKNYPFTTSGKEDIEIKIGDPNKTITGKHTYVISYQISGALTYFEDFDELYWNAIGTSWDVGIDNASITLNFPQDIPVEKVEFLCYTGKTGSKDNNCKGFQKTKGQIDFKISVPLQPQEGFTIVVSFPKGFFQILEPELYKPNEKMYLIYAGIILCLILSNIILPVRKIWALVKENNNLKSKQRIVAAWFDPPKKKNSEFFTPGETVAIAGKISSKLVTSEIIYLAQRGYLKIVDLGKKDFAFIKTKDTDDTFRKHQKTLFSVLFGTGSEITTQEMKKSSVLGARYNDMVSEVYKQVQDEQVSEENIKKIGEGNFAKAFLSLFIGGFVGFFVYIIAATKEKKLTDFGIQAYSEAISLKNFLSSQEEQLDFQAQEQIFFEKLLPYATAFGVENVWAKRFEGITLQKPDWYEGDFSPMRFAVVNSAINRSVSGSIATANRSSSGFSSGFSGGSSGGGGGGGGGGSW